MNDNEPKAAGLAPWIWAIAAAVAGLQFAVAGNYGIFRDELYYLACAARLDWGYVDQPPLSIFLLWLWEPIAGSHIGLLRLPCALAMGGVTVLTAALARDMGGGRTAQTLAALAAALCPYYLGFGGFYSMNAYDALIWAVAFWILVRIIRGGDSRWWLAFGVVCGLGLMNKMGMAFFGAALVVAMAATPMRREFLRPQLYLGGAIAALLFLPYVVWMYAHDWAPFEFMHNASTRKNADTNPLQFFLELIITMNPFYAPIWIGGLAYLAFGKGVRAYRPFAIIWVALFLFYSLQNGKAYYLAAAFPPILAAGGVLYGQWLSRRKTAWPRYAAVGFAVLAGLLLTPMSLPILTPAGYQRFEATLGLAPPASEKGHVGAPLPQHFSDRFGWPELAAAVAEVYNALPEEERARCVILTNNYGQAGALEYYGPALGLPRVICPHNTYWFWGPGEVEDAVIIGVGGYSEERMNALWASHEFVRRMETPYALDRSGIYVMRGLKVPIDDVWAGAKTFI